MSAIEEAINGAEPPAALAPHSGSEQDLALRFAARIRGKFRWSPGLGWMVNRGHNWERDDTLQRFTIAKPIAIDAASEPVNEKSAARLESAATVAAMIGLAQSEPGIATAVNEWDAHPMLLNTPSGVFDLATGRNIEGDFLFRQVTATAPDAAQATPAWSRFLQQVFGGDADVLGFMQRMAGYCLTGDTREQKLFFLHGTGSNGKSVFVDTIAGIMGAYVHKLPAEALMTKQHDEHPTVYAALFGKRLAVSSEIEANGHWAESKIKELTGDATMTARYMRQDFFTFPVTHKHLIAGNYRPRLRGDDYAMARRVVLIPFAQTFTGADCDPGLPAKLRAEYPGILAWAIEGARQWADQGLGIPTSIAGASERYMRENDDVAMWVEDCAELRGDAETPSSELYDSFKRWKEAAGEHAPSVRSFSQQLERKGLDRHHTRGGSVFNGIRLGTTAEGYARTKWGEA